MSAVRPANESHAQKLDLCCRYLADARQLARGAGCPRLLRKIKSAVASAGGAQRHLSRRLSASRS